MRKESHNFIECEFTQNSQATFAQFHVQWLSLLLEIRGALLFKSLLKQNMHRLEKSVASGISAKHYWFIRITNHN